MTSLYALVFFFLAFGYTSSGVVELVGERGMVARDSSWALTLAYSGLAAFGGVITTMIAATAVLRDSAMRVLPLVATTGLTPRVWLVSRALAAAVVTAAVYSAIPLGAVAGSLVSSPGATFTSAALSRHLVPFLSVTLPVMLCIAAILVAVGATTRRVLAVLIAALVLVMLWQLSLALVATPRNALLGAWIDPFANAPVLLQSDGWSTAERAVRRVRFDAAMAVNRLVWFLVAVVAMAFALARAKWPSPSVSPPEPSPVRVATESVGGRSTPFAALRRTTMAWVANDGGWRIVSALAFLNATLNAAMRSAVGTPGQGVGAGSLAAYCALVADHSRIFVILLATVYAGELLWRERELRISALIDSTPVTTRAIAAGRVAGLAVAQLRVVGALVLAAVVVFVLRGEPSIGAMAHDGSLLLAWSVFVVWLPFAQLTILALAVHALLQHKVLAHLLIILGWVLAVTLDRQGADGWWYRFAEPAVLVVPSANTHAAVAWGALAQRAAYWSAVCGALVWFILKAWPRGTGSRRKRR
ncbi:MAG TPA: hypothetical protein VE869_09765 [Gemmatimonas sp.]|nr:hypothetical protein [Gemmatimonas sp.]